MSWWYCLAWPIYQHPTLSVKVMQMVMRPAARLTSVLPDCFAHR